MLLIQVSWIGRGVVVRGVVCDIIYKSSYEEEVRSFRSLLNARWDLQ
jgi:hypothetical protein